MSEMHWITQRFVGALLEKYPAPWRVTDGGGRVEDAESATVMTSTSPAVCERLVSVQRALSAVGVDDAPGWGPIRERIKAADLTLHVNSHEVTMVAMGEAWRAEPVRDPASDDIGWRALNPSERQVIALIGRPDGHVVGVVQVAHPDRDEAEARAQAMVAALLGRVR